MAKSSEYRTVVFCADEFKRLLRKQKNHALEDVLNKFIDQSDEQADCSQDKTTYLVHSMIELVHHHPQKYHEFLEDLKVKMAEGKKATIVCRDSPGCNSIEPKDVPALEALYRSLSQTYCEFQMSQMHDHINI